MLYIRSTVTLIKFGINTKNNTEEAAVTLQLFCLAILKVYIGDNDLQESGAMKVAKSMQSTSNLTVINISNNNVSKDAADDIAGLSHKARS